MNNHVMYFCDEDGELELRRCHFCSHAVLRKKVECGFGHDCRLEECEGYRAIGFPNMAERLRIIKAELFGITGRSGNDWQKEKTLSPVAFIK